MRRGGGGVKIVPRVLVEGWTMADFQEVFASEGNMAQVAEFAAKNLQVWGLPWVAVWPRSSYRSFRLLCCHIKTNELNCIMKTCVYSVRR